MGVGDLRVFGFGFVGEDNIVDDNHIGFDFLPLIGTATATVTALVLVDGDMFLQRGPLYLEHERLEILGGVEGQRLFFPRE